MEKETIQREIIHIESTQPSEKIKVRVAGYARVSSDSDDQLNSLTSQVNHYTKVIESNPLYELVDIFIDEGVSAVSTEKRDDFNRMLNDCRAGKIDRIITKSISRFARNTLDSIQTTRELRMLGVSVFFEKELLDTAVLTSENLLTLYSVLSQEESLSISQNCKRGIRARMSRGEYVISTPPYGYDQIDGALKINEEQARVVRRIFDEYVSGIGTRLIAQSLNEDGIKRDSASGIWRPNTLYVLLRNERYVGDMLLQKTFNEDTPPYNKKKNQGELPKYYIKNACPPIIDRIQFEVAQILMADRCVERNTDFKKHLLSQKIVCSECGNTFRRKNTRGEYYWVCRKHDENKTLCRSIRIPEKAIYASFVRMYNKLQHHRRAILEDMMLQLERIQNIEKRNNPEISSLNKQIADLSEQNRVYTDLMSKGILDSAQFISQTDEINRKLRSLKLAKSRLASVSAMDNIISKTADMIDLLTESPESISQIDENIFNGIVERITTDGNGEMIFTAVNEIEFSERI